MMKTIESDLEHLVLRQIHLHWGKLGGKKKQFLLNHQKPFDSNQGVFWKEETKGYLNMN